jgi:hypothetical protein
MEMRDREKKREAKSNDFMRSKKHKKKSTSIDVDTRFFFKDAYRECCSFDLLFATEK